MRGLGLALELMLLVLCVNGGNGQLLEYFIMPLMSLDYVAIDESPIEA